jgi:hypothetical protein
MAPTKEEWLALLKKTFPVEFIASEMVPIIHAENTIGDDIRTKFHGQTILMSSFQSFFVHTLNTVTGMVSQQGWPPDTPHYSITFVGFANFFHRLRACEILYNGGYPLDGYALMRDLKDRTFLMAAIALNRMTFVDSLGMKAGLNPRDIDFGKKAADNRKKVDNRITH